MVTNVGDLQKFKTTRFQSCKCITTPPAEWHWYITCS